MNKKVKELQEGEFILVPPHKGWMEVKGVSAPDEREKIRVVVELSNRQAEVLQLHPELRVSVADKMTRQVILFERQTHVAPGEHSPGGADLKEAPKSLAEAAFNRQIHRLDRAWGPEFVQAVRDDIREMSKNEIPTLDMMLVYAIGRLIRERKA